MGASHTWETRSRASARFTQIGPLGRSTRQMSEETPPASACTRTGAPRPARPRKSASARSGRKAHDAPVAALAGIDEAVMQPVGATLPELKLRRQHPVPAPVGGARRRVAIALPCGCHGFFQEFPGRNVLALRRGPGRKARAQGAACVISVRFRHRNTLDAAVDAYLALELRPHEDQARRAARL